MANSAQKAELYHLTQTCASTKDRIANIYADSRYVYRVVHDLGMLWKQHVFLTSSGNNIKKTLCSEIIGCDTFTCSFNH